MMRWLFSVNQGRLKNLIGLLAAVALLIGGIVLLLNGRAIGPAPNLEEIRALARVRQFDRAQGLLQRYLRDHPGDGRARLLMADFATQPNNPQPSLALEHVHAIRPDSPKQAARAKFFEGKAYYQQGRYDLAETCWTEAMRLDPLVPEAGWILVDLLDKESRTPEAHRIGMCMHEIEPDPVDRVRILLEMSRLDIETPEPLSQVQLFEPLIKEHPEILPLSLTVGVGLIRVNRSSDGLEMIEGTLKRYPASAEVWDAWLNALYLASEADRLAEEFARLPAGLADDPRFAKHAGMIAQIARDWPKAAAAYRRAFAFEPFNWGVCYRLRFVLRQTGEAAELDRLNQLYESYKNAYKEMRGSFFERFEPGETSDFRSDDFTHERGAYYETLSIKTLGVKPHPDLYQRFADLREKMGRFDEARAWHRLVIRDSPGNALSLAALERLKTIE
jgi:tetratricopeptide (TPR) repeat protein